MVTFPATEHHRPLAGTKLYCLATEAYVHEQLAEGCYIIIMVIGNLVHRLQYLKKTSVHYNISDLCLLMISTVDDPSTSFVCDLPAHNIPHLCYNRVR